MKDPEDEAFEELAMRQGSWQHTSGWRKKQIQQELSIKVGGPLHVVCQCDKCKALAEHAMSEVQRLGQEIEQCQCPECQIKPHASDCAVHSEPAYPKGKCDCGAQPEQEPVIDGNTSDGYHTFNELYEFRKAYNIALFNEWAANGKCSVHKSWRHDDGELCFGGGWFIVVAVLPQGQISNHYEAKDWDLFHIQETGKALFEFDGHTGADVIERLKSYTTPAQPEQEPVATVTSETGADITMSWWHEPALPIGTKLYTTPPQRTWVGLTEEDLKLLSAEWRIVYGAWMDDFARDIEAKLKDKNQ